MHNRSKYQNNEKKKNTTIKTDQIKAMIKNQKKIYKNRQKKKKQLLCMTLTK